MRCISHTRVDLITGIAFDLRVDGVLISCHGV
jgi:hypothetical protein